MCVDEKDLSAYVDGELPVSEAKKVEAHIADCHTCSTKVDKLRRLKGLFSTASQNNPEPTETRMERSRERISLSIERKPEPRFRGRRVYISFPAAAAAALFFILLGGALVIFSGMGAGSGTVPAESIPVVEKETDMYRETLAGSGEPTREEMEELIRFLSDQGASVEVKIELPNPSTFTVHGEPRLLRAAEFAEFKEKPAN